MGGGEGGGGLLPGLLIAGVNFILMFHEILCLNQEI